MKNILRFLGFFVLAAVIGLEVTGCGDFYGDPDPDPEPTVPVPVASDFEIGNLFQYEGSVTAVTITPKKGKSHAPKDLPAENSPVGVVLQVADGEIV
jgi:hypothetical protein